MSFAVTHNPSRQRFETTVDGQLCAADYQLRGNVVWMTHTGVPSVVTGLFVYVLWTLEFGYSAFGGSLTAVKRVIESGAGRRYDAIV